MCCCNLHTTTKRRGIFFSLFFVCVFLFCFRELLVDRGGWFHLVASFIRSDEHFTPVQYREIVPNLSCCSCYSIFCSFFSAGDVWEHSNYTYEYIYIYSLLPYVNTVIPPPTATTLFDVSQMQHPSPPQYIAASRCLLISRLETISQSVAITFAYQRIDKEEEE